MRLTAAWTDGPPFTLTGAEVGEMTLGGTLSLLGSTAQAGTIVGLLYAVVRSALPSSHRAGVFALLALLLPGGLILGDDELKRFEPAGLPWPRWSSASTCARLRDGRLGASSSSLRWYSSASE